jgi:PKD repeat protein
MMKAFFLTVALFIFSLVSSDPIILPAAFGGPIGVDQAEGPYPHKAHFSAPLDAHKSILWSFGDGSKISGKRNPYHIFWNPGTYQVTARYKNKFQQWKKSVRTVKVKNAVPQEFRAVYNELRDRLFLANKAIDARWDGRLSPNLKPAAWNMLANSHAGDSLLTQAHYDLAILYMDALIRLGVGAMTVAINYPSLTPNFNLNHQDYVDFFKRLRDEAKARGLDYIVEHNSILPNYSSLPAGEYYDELKSGPMGGKTRWGQERFFEAARIINEIEPDYLVLIEEPSTHDSGLELSEAEWVYHIRGVASALKNQFPNATTKLGAGSGAWESDAYTKAWALSPDLDFVETHMIPAASAAGDYFQKTLHRLDMVQSLAPQKELLTVEGWMLKEKASDVKGGAATDATAFSREVYSFWAPLDQRFLEFHMKVGHHYGFSATGPAWSRYFFAYLDYGALDLEGLSPLEILDRANAAAGIAVLEGRTTSTGNLFRDLGQGLGLSF